MRNRVVFGALVALVAASLAGPATVATASRDDRLKEYVVLYQHGASLGEAHAAIKKLGGTIVDELSSIGVAKVRSADADFITHVVGKTALAGAAQNRVVGYVDTAIDGTHAGIAPNFNAALSRNFTTDTPLVDGPCNSEPDHSCSDPANVDEAGHGTHVAGTVAAAANGLGISGVAPNVTLVNLRAGQDSGFFFLFETLAAYTYAANNGIDVVNMSFFTDPWWANCPDNPLDTLEEQIEQRTIVELSHESLDYAYANGVTLIAAEGNEHTDLGK